MPLKTRPISLLKNSGFIFTVAMAAGLAFGGGASYTEHVLVPVLAVIMTASILDISTGIFLDFKKVASPILIALTLNFIVLSGTYIGLSYLLIDDVDLHAGFVLIGAVPPAVAVIPLTFLLGGNTKLSMIGNVAAYVAALAITPLICIIFLGSNVIEPSRLLIVLGELIVAPVVLSRFLRRTPYISSVDRWRGPVVNWGFFLVIYTIVGLNRDTFLQEPDIVLPLVIITFIATFVLAEVVNRIARFLGADKADRISLMYMATRKNGGMAGAVALIFFDPRAAMPVAVMTSLNVLHFIWLTWWVRRMR
ncbi:MAG: hypothetical protein MUP21_03815 [Dehalococcoidia bacterium]|nr:hypothetical protein [Dehalococcoidia bacterium]